MKPNDPLEPLPPHDEDKDRTRWIWIVVTITVTALVVLYLLIRTNAIQEGGIIEGRLRRPSIKQGGAASHPPAARALARSLGWDFRAAKSHRNPPLATPE